MSAPHHNSGIAPVSELPSGPKAGRPFPKITEKWCRDTSIKHPFPVLRLPSYKALSETLYGTDIMLDELLNLVTAQLDLDQSIVEAWIEETGSEVAVDNVGPTRRRQLLSVLRSGRPIDAQIDSFEKTYWKMEEDAAPKLKEAIVPLLALALQRRKIEALKAKRLEQRNAPDAQQTGDMHDDYRYFCQSLDRLGGSASKVRQFKEAERAIIADLARWKAEDPRFEQLGNPWIDVHAIYAERTMERRQEGQRVRSMSSPGAPPNERPEPGSTRYWRFEPGKHPPFWQRTAQPMAVRYVELPAGFVIDANGQLVSQPVVEDRGKAVEAAASREILVSPFDNPVAALPLEAGDPEASAQESMTSQAGSGDAMEPVPPALDWPPAKSVSIEAPRPAGAPEKVVTESPAPTAPPTGVDEPEIFPGADAAPVSADYPTTVSSNSAVPPADQPSGYDANIYRDVARRIIEARLDKLWRAIGLEAWPKSVSDLESQVEGAARAGVKHEYLDEVRDFASYWNDTSFIEIIVERKSARLATQLAEDPSMRELMQAEGFEVPISRR